MVSIQIINTILHLLDFIPLIIQQLVCYVLINKPKGEYYGGLVSAPVFKNIISRIHLLEKGNTNT